MPRNNSYLQFLNLLRPVESSFLPSTLDQTAKSLLNRIACQHALGQPLTVSKAMALQDIASPATIHRKIDDLRSAGLVDVMYQGENRRTKYLVPTAKANRFFDQAGGVLLNLAVSR